MKEPEIVDFKPRIYQDTDEEANAVLANFSGNCCGLEPGNVQLLPAGMEYKSARQDIAVCSLLSIFRALRQEGVSPDVAAKCAAKYLTQIYAM